MPIEKIKPFWSYQINSTANLAHLPQEWAKLAKSAVLFSCSLPNGSHNFDFFSIAMGADYSFYVKSIATFDLTFVLASV